MKTWQGRLAGGTSPLFEAFTSSVQQDRRLAPYDVRVSQVHARALARACIIDGETADILVAALEIVAEEIGSDSLVWRDDLEDVHTHVESRLRDLVGEPADALHTGRSRNDQIATDLRLFVRDATHRVMDLLLDVQTTLLDLAERYADVLMPGYTHLQQAQPILAAQPFLAYVAMLGRDWERFRDSLHRTNLCPLGSGALAGAAFPLDRQFLATELGFTSPCENSLDAVSDRDFLVEFVTDCALCMTHLSRLAEDLVLWSSSEFRFVRLPDAFASGSSMMPQKKNPDVPELIRGKAALCIGDATAALTLVKGLPLGYNRDLQEDKTPLFHAADTLIAGLGILSAMLPGIDLDRDRTESVISSFTLATDLADHLVRQGVPFRQAHEVVGGLVARCVASGDDLSALSAADLEASSPLLSRLPELSPAASVRRKATSGSTHPEAVAEQIACERRRVGDRRGQGGDS